MALKGDRIEARTDITYFMNEVGQKGGIVVFDTIGSGAALDQAAALVKYPVVGSGAKPAGLLLCDVVDIDQTRMHLNWHINEVQKGNKVVFLQQGWVTTNQIASGITINPGDTAYVGNGGRITNVFLGGNHAKVGVFKSKLDEDGFAKVEINLP